MYISNDTGKVATLHEQTQDGNVVFSVDGGDRVTVPAGQFFGDFREATTEETEAHAKDDQRQKPLDPGANSRRVPA